MNIRTLAACAVFAASSLVHAQAINDSFTYQGTLMEGGAPANGMYDISFIVYDSEVGGSIVPGGAQSVLNVEVVDGVFEAFVDFAVSGSVFDSDQTRWLQLQVSHAGMLGYTVLAPRQRMSPAPLANYALRSGSSLQDAYENGEIIRVNSTQGVLEIHGDASQDPALFVRNELGELRAIYGHSAFDAGLLALYGPTNNSTVNLTYDNSAGGGGAVVVARNDYGTPGVYLEGNYLGSEASRILVTGPDRSISLNTQLIGNASVTLPADAINSVEMLNEAGAAETDSPTSVALTPDFSVIDVVSSVTVNAPTDGYVLVLASAELTISHVHGIGTSVELGVSSTTAFPNNGDLETRFASDSPTGSYDHVVTTQAIFPASAGSNTYYFLGNLRTASASATVLDKQVSAIFVPTAYGTVARDAGPDLPDNQTPFTGPLSSYEIIMEQNAALKADNDRQQREIDAMKVQMQQLLETTQNQPE